MNPQDSSQPEQPTDPKGQQNPPGNPAGGEYDQPQVVYMTRPVEPLKQQLSPETIQRHEDSRKKYPFLNLSQGEYVITSVPRHPIGLVSIWGVTALVITALLAAAVIVNNFSGDASIQTAAGLGAGLPLAYLLIPAVLISLLALLFGFIAAYVYSANRFYLTNESVIQHIQISLFNKREQTISLNNVEDASYTQDGIVPHLFDYGMIRLSTQGDETTYRFTYASQPAKQIALLNNAVENFKNVRPIEH